jgi:hypothetical protein
MHAQWYELTWMGAFVALACMLIGLIVAVWGKKRDDRERERLDLMTRAMELEIRTWRKHAEACPRCSRQTVASWTVCYDDGMKRHNAGQ